MIIFASDKAIKHKAERCKKGSGYIKSLPYTHNHRQI